MSNQRSVRRGVSMIYAPEIHPGSYVHFSWKDESCELRIYESGAAEPRLLPRERSTRQVEALIRNEVREGEPPIVPSRAPLDDMAFWLRVTAELNGRLPRVGASSASSASRSAPRSSGLGDSLDVLDTLGGAAPRQAPTPRRGGAGGAGLDSLDALDTGPGLEAGRTEGAGYPVGHIIAGRFRVEALLGVGGMGEVYRVYDDETREMRALKTIRGEWLESEGAQRRFREEATLSQKLRHPGIVETYDIGNDGGTRFYTMELVTGGSLRGRIAERAEARRPFSVAEAVEIADQLLDALVYAHTRTIHRDIKPENILLTAEGRPKLADFGLAKLIEPGRMESMAGRVGTAYYMAPEQFRGEAGVDARADLYSVGVVLYELLTGHIPQGAAEKPSARRAGLPGALDDVVMRAIAPRAEGRFADADAFRGALRAAAGGVKAKQRSEPTSRGGAAKWIVLAAAVAIAGGGAAVWSLREDAGATHEASPRGPVDKGSGDTAGGTKPISKPAAQAPLPAPDPKRVMLGYLAAGANAADREDAAASALLSAAANALAEASLQVVDGAPVSDRESMLAEARAKGAGKLVIAKVQAEEIVKGGHHAAQVRLSLEAIDPSNGSRLGSAEGSALAISPSPKGSGGWNDAVRVATSYALKDHHPEQVLVSKLAHQP